MIKDALRPLPIDTRDFQLGVLVTLPKLTELPDSFSLPVPEIKDQNLDGNYYSCTAYATTSVSSLQEDVDLWPEFTSAAAKESPTGNDLRTAMASHVEFGAAESVDVTPEEKSLNGDERRDFTKYSDHTKERALYHAKGSYVLTKGSYDAYDNIRASIWYYRNEKRAVVIGVQFGWDVSDYILSGTPQGSGHCLYIIGWDPDGLIVVNSAGKSAGRNGIHRMTRDTIEAYVKVYGAYMFIDATPDEIRAKLLHQNQGLIMQVLTALKNFPDVFVTWLNLFADSLQKKTEPMEPTTSDKIFTAAESWMGRDASPQNEAPLHYECAESVNAILATIDLSIKGLVNKLSTYWMDYALMKDPSWKPANTIEPGCILIYPTGTGSHRNPDGSLVIPNGHVFIAGKDNKLMSNTSTDGIWRYNYTLAQAQERWIKRGGYAEKIYVHV